METWGVEVKSGETQKVKPEFGKLIHISQAMIHISEDEPKNFKGPRLKIDDKYFTIGRKSTQIGLRLVLPKEFELSHNYKNGSVFFLGYIADDPVSGLDKPNSEITKITEKLPDEDDYSAALDELREWILTVDTDANSMNPKQDRYLYILLGFDNLLFLNFDELCKSDKSSSESKLELRILFSHRKAQTTGVLFPLGMGLFFSDSKFHFFGGESLEYFDQDCTSPPQYGLSHIYLKCMGLPPNVRPKYGKQWYKGMIFSYVKSDDEEWFNKTVFSSLDLPLFTPVNPPSLIPPEHSSYFTPVNPPSLIPPEHSSYFTPVNPPSLIPPEHSSYFTPVNPSLIPKHSSCKFRPLVFTILEKTYALSSGPISTHLSTFEHDYDKLKFFEVYDHVKKEWRDLDNPPEGLCYQIIEQSIRITGHCVFGKKMLLRTYAEGGDYLFDSESEKWEQVDNLYPHVLAGIVISDKYLLVLTGEYKLYNDATLPSKLVVYELDSFGKGNKIAAELDIYKNVVDLNAIYLFGASFQPLHNSNLINLVLVSYLDIQVLVLKVEMLTKCAVVLVHKKFDFPEELSWFDEQLHSTFIL